MHAPISGLSHGILCDMCARLSEARINTPVTCHIPVTPTDLGLRHKLEGLLKTHHGPVWLCSTAQVALVRLIWCLFSAAPPPPPPRPHGRCSVSHCNKVSAAPTVKVQSGCSHIWKWAGCYSDQNRASPQKIGAHMGNADRDWERQRHRVPTKPGLS